MNPTLCLPLVFFAVFAVASGGLLHGFDSPHFVVIRGEEDVRPQRPANARPNLAQLAEQLNLTEFVTVLEETKVGHTINHEGPYTVFAPTNEAFARIPDYAKAMSKSDIIKFHVARGDYLEKELKDNMLIRSLLSKRDVRINFYKGADGKRIVTANGRTLNQTDFDAHNGVLHIVDDIMGAIYEREGTAFRELDELPAEVKTLKRALTGVGLDSVLDGQGPFTVFAPSDDAFAKLPDDIVQYLLKNETAMKEVLLNHVVPAVWYSPGLIDGMTLKSAQGSMLTIQLSGGSVTVNKINVSLPDFTVANGVIHVIDGVIIPKQIASIFVQ